jgi:hypothetical protein
MNSSNSFHSPASKLHQTSFGLLDENLIQNLSIENEQNIDPNAKRLVAAKPPPVPNSKKSIRANMSNERLAVAMSENRLQDHGHHDELEAADATVESIRLNESDLNKMCPEFTFDEEEEDDDGHVNPEQNRTRAEKQQCQGELSLMNNENELDQNRTLSNSQVNDECNERFKSLFERDSINKSDAEMLLDESSKILQNSMGEPFPNFNSQSNVNTKNAELSMHNENETTFNNNNCNSLSDRYKQMIMESVERVKRRTAMCHSSELTFVQQPTNPYLNEDDPYLLFNQQKNGDTKNRRFSAASVRTICSNFGTNQKQSPFETNSTSDQNNTLSAENNNLTQSNMIDDEFGANSSTILNEMSASASLLKTPMQLDRSEKRIEAANRDRPQLTSFYFKPTEVATNVDTTTVNNELNNASNVFVSANDFAFDNQNPFDISTNNAVPDDLFDMKHSAQECFGQPSQSCFDEPPEQQQQIANDSFGQMASMQANLIGEMNGGGDFDDFVDGQECKHMFDEDEEENIKKYEFSVCVDTSNNIVQNECSSRGSSSSESNEKWWNNVNIQQVSKLELSNMTLDLNNTKQQMNNSCVSSSSEKQQQQQQQTHYQNQTQNDTSSSSTHLSNKQKATTSMRSSNETVSNETKSRIAVDVYFNRKSQLPEFLAEKEADVNLSLIDEKRVNLSQPVTTQQQQSKQECKSSNEQLEKSVSSEDLSDADNFTLSNNSNIQASMNSFSFTFNTSDTGEFIQRKSTLLKKSTFIQSNLKTIGEELDSVSNRLALTSQTSGVKEKANNNNQIKVPSSSMPQQQQQQQINTSNSNYKIMLMDETISSITSTELSVDMRKMNHHHHHHHHHNNKSTCSSHHDDGQAMSKKKSGSLTSTPSKLNNKQTSLNSLANKSDVSSITDRSNESTILVRKQRNYHHDQNSQHNHHSEVSRSHSQSKPRHNHKLEEMQSNEAHVNVNSLLPQSKSEDILSNRVSMSSSTSANDLTASSLTSAINHFASTLLTNSSAGSTGLVPVAFLPFNAFIPCVQKMSDDLHKSMDNQSIANNSSTSNASVSSIKSFDLPQIVLNKEQVDFGYVAEGCTDVAKILIEMNNLNSTSNSTSANTGLAHLQIELDDISEWSVEPIDPKEKCSSKLHANVQFESQRKLVQNLNLKSKLRNSLSIHMNKLNLEKIDSQTSLTFSDGKNKLKYDLLTSFYEFFVHLDTKDLNVFKELLNATKSNANESTIYPILVKTNIYVYYCLNNNKKYLLNRIDLRYTLGYARLKTNANIETIELDMSNLPVHSNNSFNIRQDQLNSGDANEDNDKTLTSMCDEAHDGVEIRLDQYVPLSNAGNIDIFVDCYFSFEENGHSYNHLDTLYFNQQYMLQLEQPSLCLQNKCKQKYNVKFKLFKLNQMSKTNGINKLDEAKIKMIVQVRPNGFKYELPMKLKLMQTIDMERVQLASSKSVLYFGRSLSSKLNNGFYNELTLKNTSDCKIRCQLDILVGSTSSSSSSSVCSFGSVDSCSKSQPLLFQFAQEMKSMQKAITFNESMTQMIVSFDAKEIVSLKLKYNSHSSKSKESLIGQAVLKVSILGSTRRFNIKLYGFSYESRLQIHNLNTISNENHSFDELLRNKNITRSCYLLELFKSKSSFKNAFKLSNSTSTNSKCLVYPILIEKNKLSEVPSVMKSSNETHFLLDKQSNRSIKLFVNDSFEEMNGLMRFEVKANDSSFLTLEFESDQSKHSMGDLSNYVCCLFWIEYELFAYCMQHVNKNDLLQDKASNFVDLFILRLLLFNARKEPFASLSSFESNSSIVSVNQSLNNSTISNYVNRGKSMKDDCIRLLRQSLKCLLLNLQVEKQKADEKMPGNMEEIVDSRLLDFTLNNSISHDSIVSAASNLHTNESKQQVETWTVSQDTLIIQDIEVKDDETYEVKFKLKNNLNRKMLAYHITYRTSCLDISPNNGTLNGQDEIEISVRPTREVLKKLPWFGTINITCNKIQKDVRIYLYPSDVKHNQIMTMKKSSSTTSFHSTSNSISSTATSNNSKSSQQLLSSSSSIEQGTLLSEISQYTIDSLSLTPLINASFNSTISSPNLTNKKNTAITSKSMPKNDSSITFKGSMMSCASDELPIQVVRSGSDAQIKFPQVQIGQKRSFDLILTNPTSSNVIWKAFSMASAYLRAQENLMKSAYSVFSITPNSGVIPPLQKQSIKIEFCPRESSGVFNQQWQIDTRVDLSSNSQYMPNLANPQSSFNCKLILSGVSVCDEASKEQNSLPRSAFGDRILSSRTNMPFGMAGDNQLLNKNKVLQRQTSELLTSTSKREFKENISNNSTGLSSSLISTRSSTASNSYSTQHQTDSRKLTITNKEIQFSNTEVNKTSKEFIIIHNKEEFECKLTIIPILEPFYCKHKEIRIIPKHYLKLPIEFRPKKTGDYVDKILIRVDKYDLPLTCLVKAKSI